MTRIVALLSFYDEPLEFLHRLITSLPTVGVTHQIAWLVRSDEPFFAYRGRNVETAMNFKKLVRGWGPDDYADYYRDLLDTGDEGPPPEAH